MAIFKRIEVWIVLVLLLGLAGYVIVTSSTGRSDSGGGARDGDLEPRLRIVARQLTRDYGNAKLDLTIVYDNRGGTELASTPPDIRLGAADGSEVDPFFLAGDFPPTIPAGRESRVTLAFWLQPEHFGQALELCVRDACVPVKSSAPFDIGSVENQGTREFGSADW